MYICQTSNGCSKEFQTFIYSTSARMTEFTIGLQTGWNLLYSSHLHNNQYAQCMRRSFNELLFCCYVRICWCLLRCAFVCNYPARMIHWWQRWDGCNDHPMAVKRQQEDQLARPERAARETGRAGCTTSESPGAVDRGAAATMGRSGEETRPCQGANCKSLIRKAGQDLFLVSVRQY